MSTALLIPCLYSVATPDLIYKSSSYTENQKRVADKIAIGYRVRKIGK